VLLSTGISSGVATSVEDDGYGSAGTAGVKKIAISSDLEWTEALYSPFTGWNPLISGWTGAERRVYTPLYIGEYYALLRYKTQVPRGAKLGLQLATGYAPYGGNTQQNKLNRHYIQRGDDETDNTATSDDGYHWLNMGKVTVGGALSSVASARISMNQYSLAVNMAAWDMPAGETLTLWLDCIELIPAEQYLHIHSPVLIPSDKQVEFLQDSSGKQAAYLTRATSSPEAWRTGLYAGDVLMEIADWEAVNWTVPGGNATSALVAVFGTDPGRGGYGPGAWHAIRLEALPRMRGGFYG
jgi:hypothetical protein